MKPPLEISRTALQQCLDKLAVNSNPAIFFKTAPGEYAAHDRFKGITVPSLRALAKQVKDLAVADVEWLLYSPFNEYRLLALFIIVDRYRRADDDGRVWWYQFYCANLSQVNNWNLVDSSAHLIIGMHLADKAKDSLVTLAQSSNLWERRIAIIATWWFIRRGEYTWTFKIATMLLHDPHDLIHKAVGWMLRELGKRDVAQLEVFLNKYATVMPRTMLRYALEKFSSEIRASYLKR